MDPRNRTEGREADPQNDASRTLDKCAEEKDLSFQHLGPEQLDILMQKKKNLELNFTPLMRHKRVQDLNIKVNV